MSPRTSASTDSSHGSSRGTPGLPGDEYRALRKLQQRNRLEEHFAHNGSSKTRISPQTPKPADGHSISNRVHASDVKYTTRKALGANFDFTDGGYERARAATEARRTVGQKEQGKHEKAIPQKYIDEFNKKWQEDDERYESDLWKAYCTDNAAWRKHEAMYSDIAPLVYKAEPRYMKHTERVQRVPSYVANSSQYTSKEPVSLDKPSLVSRFSFDSVVTERRSFFRGSRPH